MLSVSKLIVDGLHVRMFLDVLHTDALSFIDLEAAQNKFFELVREGRFNSVDGQGRHNMKLKLCL